MKEVASLIESLQKGTTDPIGYSVFGYGDNGNKAYDIYLPTMTLANFYFLIYRNGLLYDANSNRVEPSNYRSTLIPTQDLVEMNFKKFLNYNECCIVEHELVGYANYILPARTDADEYVSLGWQASATGDYDKAFDNYCKAIAERPYDPNLYRIRSGYYVERKKISLAIDDTCRAAIANPISNQNVYTFVFGDLAVTYKANRNFEAAAKCYTIVIDNYRRESWNVRDRAICFSKLGLHDQAINDIKQLIAEEKSIELLKSNSNKHKIL